MASEANHPWCRDVSRDEAVRAAEDAAAVPAIMHRDLPEVVADLRERVAELTTKHNALADLARLDAGWLKANEQRLTDERDAARARVAELEAAPPPRGWLTAEMRDDLDEALEWLNCQTNVFAKRAAAAIATTLARETPPRVKRPNPNVVITTVDARERIDRQWIAAIRAAGGEVCE